MQRRASRRRSTQYEIRTTQYGVARKGRMYGLKYDEQGLIPAVVQDVATGEVLMVAWMNAAAFERTRETGQAHFWSRSREELWHKGANSGNVIDVQAILVDCDA